jgi:hypothetical protein
VRRRAFITLLGGAAAWPLAARAQQTGKIYRIGFLANDPTIPAQPAGQAFLDGLRENGFIEGNNIIIERRFAEGRLDRYADLVAELVQLRVDAIVTSANEATLAAKRASTKIPNALNADTIREMHLAFRRGGRKAIQKVMRNQPAVFLKLLVLLVPRQMTLDHSGGVKAMTDEQLERSIEFIEQMIAKRDSGANAKVIDGVAEPAALPAPRKPRRKVRRSDRADSGLAARVVGTDSAGGNS